MKQQIVQISNIKATEPIYIMKLADATQTRICDEYKRKNPTASKEQLNTVGHKGLALAVLLNHYEFTYDVETIRPTDVRYQEAVDEIATYVKTDWWMDDVDSYLSDKFDLLDEYYYIDFNPTLYMYFDDWIQFGYEAYLGVADWNAAFHHIIYEYMRQFLTIEIS